MSAVVVIDNDPLGLATRPRRSTQSEASAIWLQSPVLAEVRVVIPEIADYQRGRLSPRS